MIYVYAFVAGMLGGAFAVWIAALIVERRNRGSDGEG